jgi:hypothetical protein
LGGGTNICRGQNHEAEQSEVTIAELGAIGEFVGSIAVLITLIYLAIQVRQNTRHVRAQMGHDGWLSTEDDDIAMMGDDPAETLAKAELGDEPLTDRDLKIVDAYFKALVMHMARVEHLNSQGLEIYTAEQTASAFVYQFNCTVGKVWWESNRAYIELMAPTVGACTEDLLDEPNCPSRAESFKEFRRRLNAEPLGGKL